MPASPKISLESFVDQCRSQMIPLNSLFSYFSATPLDESALKRLLHDPVAAVPPAVGKLLSGVGVLLVPFLEDASGNGRPAKGNTAKGTKTATRGSRPRGATRKNRANW